ncbi:uncharacterized protein TNCV_2139501 [Trichonephila clavipes]|uniref:Uncharacterized protein n=1 Tax=Trichonephila clavipes TaxID=2585209 RepID=A0A8X6RWQ5_TRICX|nr:uncharacterized protein TNCV_2139501 [Trichonephila clavipes]
MDVVLKYNKVTRDTLEQVHPSPYFFTTPTRGLLSLNIFNIHHPLYMVDLQWNKGVAVAEWSRYRIVAGIVMSSSPVPLKNRRVGQRCTLNLPRAQTSSHWCGVVIRRGGASSGVIHVT